MLLSEILGHPFPLSGLLDFSTPRSITEEFAKCEVAPKSFEAVPYFLVHGKVGYSVLRPAFRGGLCKDREVVVFELPGLRGEQPTPIRIKGIAAVYVEQLSSRYPIGPIHLGSGGLIALEMAQQLRDIGHPPYKIALIDQAMHKELSLRRQKKSDSFLRRLMLAPYTDRFSGQVSPEDFADDRLQALGAKVALRRRQLRNGQHRLRKASKQPPKLHGFNLAAKGQLATSYRHYRPQPAKQQVNVICTPSQQAEILATDGIWQRLLPDCVTQPVLNEHSDVGSPIAAQTLESVFEPVPPKKQLAIGMLS